MTAGVHLSGNAMVSWLTDLYIEVLIHVVHKSKMEAVLATSIANCDAIETFCDQYIYIYMCLPTYTSNRGLTVKGNRHSSECIHPVSSLSMTSIPSPEGLGGPSYSLDVCLVVTGLDAC
jgi:hypothetical protein